MAAANSGEGRRRWSRWFWVATVLSFLWVLHTHYRLALVVGQSMRPGLHTGDLLLVDKWSYQSGSPERGDIVLARYGREYIVKRVVGLPGEAVALVRGHLQVNGATVAERHPIEPGALDISPGKLFPGRFALLGDNRSLSPHQSVSAVVNQEQLIGRVVACWRWNRFVML